MKTLIKHLDNTNLEIRTPNDTQHCPPLSAFLEPVIGILEKEVEQQQQREKRFVLYNVVGMSEQKKCAKKYKKKHIITHQLGGCGTKTCQLSIHCCCCCCTIWKSLNSFGGTISMTTNVYHQQSKEVMGLEVKPRLVRSIVIM